MGSEHLPENPVAFVRRLRDEANLLRNAVAPVQTSSSSISASLAFASGLFPPDFLDGYEFVREIHRGGQGLVYEATQNATRRKVAIKLLHGIKPNSRAARRFDREAELITQLRHPNVVTVLDAGERGGVCFLIMEYVDGLPIDAYLEANQAKLSTKTLVGLFAQVCDGVAAAHMKGIVHRDLKPANILVDAEGQPRVLDFGLAKVAGENAESSGHCAGESGDVATIEVGQSAFAGGTLDGQFVGSLLWASPEQAAGDHTNTDMRTDVYSLGVVLYQLLTGNFPYEIRHSFREVRERIENATPAPLRGSAASSPRRFPVDCDLEAIVLKCLSKAPAERYPTSGDVAAELRRYVSGEAVQAMGNGTTYVLRKWIRRNRGKVATLGAAFVAVIVAAVVAVTQMQAARRAEAALRATMIKLAAQNQELQLQKRDTIRAASTWAPLALNLISPAIKRESDHRQEFADRLRRAVTREIDSQRQMEISSYSEATLRRVAAALFQRAGLWADAERELQLAIELHQRSGGDSDVDVASARANLGLHYLDLGRYEEAEPLLESAVQILRTAAATPADFLDLASALDGLGRVLSTLAQSRKAKNIFEEALAIRRKFGQPEDRSVAASLNSQAYDAYQRADFVVAEQVAREAVRMFRQLDAGGSDLASALNNLGMALQALDDPTAEATLREVVELFGNLLGEDSYQFAIARNNLGIQVLGRGDADAAENIFRDSLRTLEGDPAGRQYLPHVRVGLARALIQKRELDEAEQNLKAAEATLFSENAPIIARHKFCQTMIELNDALHAAHPQGKYDRIASQWRSRLEKIQIETP